MVFISKIQSFALYIVEAAASSKLVQIDAGLRCIGMRWVGEAIPRALHGVQEIQRPVSIQESSWGDDGQSLVLQALALSTSPKGTLLRSALRGIGVGGVGA